MQHSRIGKVGDGIGLLIHKRKDGKLNEFMTIIPLTDAIAKWASMR
ncbi:hypothetical protein [Bartonella queenslandensis]|nr:hypothetical protein [Bartonella queenslandensis]